MRDREKRFKTPVTLYNHMTKISLHLVYCRRSHVASSGFLFSRGSSNCIYTGAVAALFIPVNKMSLTSSGVEVRYPVKDDAVQEQGGGVDFHRSAQKTVEDPDIPDMKAEADITTCSTNMAA